ncbi:hypothetical protein HNR42_002024 [Deinobacterium chartae]|uniref:Uncharacterized protein n=1 Tax=Deinobacterium chartae TaxID=521158 RepID=A0A841I2F1_9DEIO|nr:hypothetical protein [Deinobacterium chartae]MBB6098590.1 hypothetical protein [Deinobacterium chartae]
MEAKSYLNLIEQLLEAMWDGRVPVKPIAKLSPSDVPPELQPALGEVLAARHLWARSEEVQYDHL